MHKYFDIFNNAFLSLFIDELIGDESYTLCFSNISRSRDWNGANKIDIGEGFVGETIVDIELLFATRRMSPIFWLTQEDTPKNVEFMIRDKGYLHKGTDYWMKYDNTVELAEKHNNLRIEQVVNEEMLYDFLHLYQEVWTDLKYQDAFKKKVFDPQYSGENKIFIGYDSNDPVSIGGYVTYQDSAFFHSIMTRENKREKGFAFHLIKHMLADCGKNEVLLRIDTFGGNRTFYEKIGFKELMQVKVYSK